MDGVADLNILGWPHIYQYRKHFDFITQPNYAYDYRIWYAKTFKLKGDPVRGIFDGPSYALIILGFLGICPLVWMVIKREDCKIGISYVITWLVGHIFGQGLPVGFTLRKKSGNAIIMLFIFTTLFLRLMYLSMVITNITAMEKGPTVDSLEQLAKENHRKVVTIGVTKSNYQQLDLINNIVDQLEFM